MASPLDYKIPSVFVGQQIPGQVAPQQAAGNVSAEAPVPKDYLATIKGYTDKYIDAYGQLDAFAKSMAKDYGIDVFQPDFSQQGGGSAFQTAHNLQASLMYAANDLKESRDVNKFMREQQAAGNILPQPGFDMTTQSSAQTDPHDMFYSTGLDKQVSEANDTLNKEFYTEAEAQKANQLIREPLVRYYQQQIAQDPQNAEYYKRQLAAVGSAVKKTPYAAFLSKGKGSAGGGFKSSQPGIALLKKITNIKSGVWGDGSYKPVNVDGKVYVANNELTGDSMGQYVDYDKNGVPIYKPKIVKRWLKDPDTGEVFAEFVDPNIPIEAVSTQPGSSVAATFISNNSKYGDVAKTMEAAEQMGLLDDTGSSVDEMLLPADYAAVKDKVRGTGKAASEKIKAVSEAVKTKLKSLNDPFFGNDYESFEKSDGGEIQIGKHRGKDSYYIENWKELGYPKPVTNLTLEDVIRQLSDPQINYKGFNVDEPSVKVDKKQNVTSPAKTVDTDLDDIP